MLWLAYSLAANRKVLFRALERIGLHIKCAKAFYLLMHQQQGTTALSPRSGKAYGFWEAL